MIPTAKILYFIAGPVPTKKDYEGAKALSGKVVFRNALAVPNYPHALETCDGVAGAIPPAYAVAYPLAGEAIKAKEKEADRLLASDVSPPKKKAVKKNGN